MSPLRIVTVATQHWSCEEDYGRVGTKYVFIDLPHRSTDWMINHNINFILGGSRSAECWWWKRQDSKELINNEAAAHLFFSLRSKMINFNICSLDYTKSIKWLDEAGCGWACALRFEGKFDQLKLSASQQNIIDHRHKYLSHHHQLCVTII